jgi:hypothetical protein
MSLTPVGRISDLADGIEATLDSNGFYTLDTEKELFKKYSVE